jgi:hypothetical protein
MEHSGEQQQPDLPAQQTSFPMQRPTSLPTITVAELDQQCQDLRTLLTATLVALLVLAVSLNGFLFKQMRQAREKVIETRPAIQRLQTQYREKEQNMKNFIVALQTFAATHRDFQPVLDKYRYDLPQFLAPPATAGTAPPGIKVPSTTPTSPPLVQPARPADK